MCEAAAGEREALLTHMEEQHKETFHLLVSKGALSSSPPSENSETEQNPPTDQRDVTHRKVSADDQYVSYSGNGNYDRWTDSGLNPLLTRSLHFFS